eukprot:scaffold16595_cov232-Amphora_coffeaeformis.AAC.5
MSTCRMDGTLGKRFVAAIQKDVIDRFTARTRQVELRAFGICFTERIGGFATRQINSRRCRTARIGKSEGADEGRYEGMSEGKSEGIMVGVAVPSEGILEGTSDEVSIGELVGKSGITIGSAVGEPVGVSDWFTPEGGDEAMEVGSSVVDSTEGVPEGEAEGASVTTVAVVGLEVGAEVSAGVGSSDGTSEAVATGVVVGEVLIVGDADGIWETCP